ncbi:MAG: hypothetical protein K9K68_05255 [Methylococcaceae bacterium]|nr:hypothetical protein [Methylococcaceae bacterium]
MKRLLDKHKRNRQLQAHRWIISLSVAASLSWFSSSASSDNTGNSYRRLHQGGQWTATDWKTFYSLDQGSLIMPYAWMVALKEANGQLFLRDSLSRYGYLPNPKGLRNPEGLPLGFLVANKRSQTPEFSMNCAACHTRQLSVGGVNYRADGGPAFSDMFSFIKDLDAAVEYTLSDGLAFSQFQQAIQAQGAPIPTREQLAKWYLPYHTLVRNSLTSSTASWGIGRLDALSMIENRAAGLDIGAPEDDYLIPHNIFPANVPVRYPFLWNAPKQDLTQWAGTSVNGNSSYGLKRNAGEVIGVFGVIYPKADPSKPNGYDFLSSNSMNFDGLLQAEKLVKKIGPPKWPWAIDKKKAAKGKAIYANACGPNCHEIKKGEPRPPVRNTWLTPVIDVHTDTKYYELAAKETVSSGLLSGFSDPVNPSAPLIPPTGASSLSLVAILNNSILTQKYPKINVSLRPPASVGVAYESRVMQGVWAAAPYLHNGSVPSLAELLKPSPERVKTFQVGPEYDIVNVGLAAAQPGGVASIRVTTDCSDRNSGNSNCGHEFGTLLPKEDKDALLEYLKTL